MVKYGDRMQPGEWASIAARKVVSHLRDRGYIGGFTMDEVMEEVRDWASGTDAAMYQPDEGDFNRLRARLTDKMNNG